MKYLFYLLIASVTLGCIEPTNPFTKLPPGKWRGVLYLERRNAVKPAQDITRDNKTVNYAVKEEGELPFNFEIVYESKDDFHMVIHNGDERIRIDDIQTGVDKKSARDTFRFNIPGLDSYLHGVYEGNVIQGYWTVPYRGNYKIPFVAYYGDNYRFEDDVDINEKMNVNGKWAVIFEEGENAYPAIGQFKQNGEHITGTFNTETGDYRYLEGR
jgi:hypothetical protein